MALVLAALALAIAYYPQLPDRMASHFDGAGQANGWSPKASFFGLEAFILVLMTACFAIMPALIEGLPPRLVNLPNKDYWLAPERRAATMASISSALTWFGCAVLAFLIAITWLVIRVNLGLEAGLPSPPTWGLLAGIVACVVLLMLRFLYLGRRPPP
jgi:serine/threonine-protein kinase